MGLPAIELCQMFVHLVNSFRRESGSTIVSTLVIDIVFQMAFENRLYARVSYLLNIFFGESTVKGHS